MVHKVLIFSLLVLFSLQGYSQLKSDRAVSGKELIHQLIELVNKEGGVQSEIEKEDSLQTIRAWLKVNGESIYKAKANNLKKPNWGYYTKSRKALYAHVFDWPEDGRLVINKEVKVINAWLLSDLNSPLKIEVSKKGDTLILPKVASDEIASVIKLYVLPGDDWANLDRYAGANAELEKASKSENRVVFMGNSITERWDRFDSAFFPSNPYINRGISGQTTAQMLLRFRQDVIELEPKVVVIHAGTNDLASNRGPVTVEQIAGNISSMAELARANNIKVVLAAVMPAISYSWRPGVEPADKIIELNALIKAYAKKNKIVYLDYYTPMVNDKKGLKKEYGRDTVHPSTAGYKVMTPLVHAAIAKALKRDK